MFKDIISGIVSGVIGGLVVLIIQLYLDYRKNARENRLKMLAGNKTQKILDENFLYNYEPGKCGIEKIIDDFGQPYKIMKGKDDEDIPLLFYRYIFQNAKVEFCIYAEDSNIVSITVFALEDKKFPVKCVLSPRDDAANFGSAKISEAIIEYSISFENISSPRHMSALIKCRFVDYTPIKYLFYCFEVDGNYESIENINGEIIKQVCVTQTDSICPTFSIWDTFYG